VVCVGNSIPFRWDGDPASLRDGIDGVLGSGSFVIPGALVPVEIDVARDGGIFVEPNQWMLHPVEPEIDQPP
jgi:hypothetical protein